MDVNRHNIKAIYPLSPVQQGMLFHTLHTPASGVYFEQLICTLDEGLDVSALKASWQRVVERHPILRTFFVWEHRDRPLQIVREQVKLPWEEYDWRGDNLAKKQAQLEGFLEIDRRRGFDLTKAPLMRLSLIRVTQETYQFVWSFHHILMDGWCLPLILKEVSAFYEAFRHGKDLYLETPRPYQDYIAWLQQQDLSKAETFWRERLRGFTAPTSLETNWTTSASPDQTQGYGEQQVRLSVAATAALQAFARQHQLTLNTLVQGAWALFLSRYSGEEDVVFGVTVSGRSTDLVGVESMIGLFINTLPMRVQSPREAPLLPWLTEIQAQQVNMQQYEYTPLAEMQRWSRAPHGTPLFESILVFENFPLSDFSRGHNGDLKIRDLRCVEKTNYPLTVIAGPGTELLLRMSYDCSRFDAATITRMLIHFQTLLQDIVQDSQRKLAEIKMILEEEREQWCSKFGDDLESILSLQESFVG